MLRYESPGQPELQEPPTNSVWVCTRGFFSMDRSALISGRSLELAEPRDVQGGELMCFVALCLSPELQWWVCGHKAAESEILSKRGFPPSCPIRLADGASVPVAIDLQFFFQTRGRQQPYGSLCNSPLLLVRVPVRLPPPMFSWRGGVGSRGRQAPGPGGAPSGTPGSGCQAGPFWLKFSRGRDSGEG